MCFLNSHFTVRSSTIKNGHLSRQTAILYVQSLRYCMPHLGTLLCLPTRPVFLIDCMEPVPRFDWEQLTDPNYYEIGLYILELHKG